MAKLEEDGLVLVPGADGSGDRAVHRGGETEARVVMDTDTCRLMMYLLRVGVRAESSKDGSWILFSQRHSERSVWLTAEAVGAMVRFKYLLDWAVEAEHRAAVGELLNLLNDRLGLGRWWITSEGGEVLFDVAIPYDPDAFPSDEVLDRCRRWTGEVVLGCRKSVRRVSAGGMTPAEGLEEAGW